jgi:hypothetical protein
VIECEQPSRKQRRGTGKSDSIDAHLAVLAALRLDTDRLPVPRADGDREALRILLVARQEITMTHTAQTNRLRALLLAGDDTDRRAARRALSKTALAALAGRQLPAQAGREHAIRQAEIRRLALALGQAREQLKDNRTQLLAIVEDIAPGLTSHYGVGPVSAAQAIVRFSHHGRCRSEAAFAALGGTSPIPASSGQAIRHRLNHGGDRASTAPSTPSRCAGSAAAPAPAPTSPGAPPKEDPTRNPPLPQALHRPRALPASQPVDEAPRRPLTNIEASERPAFESLRARQRSHRSGPCHEG